MPQTDAALVAIWRATVGASSMAGAPARPYGTSALRGRGPVPRAIIRSSGALVIELVSPPDCFLQESRHDPLRMPAPEARRRVLRSPVIILEHTLCLLTMSLPPFTLTAPVLSWRVSSGRPPDKSRLARRRSPPP